MKYAFAIFFGLMLIILTTDLRAQQIEEFDFIGFVQSSDSLTFSYRTVVRIENGKVSGHSITDYLGTHETRTEISGTYDYTSHTIKFRETDLSYTKSPLRSDLCYLNVEARLGTRNKSATLSGSFVGKYNDESACANGIVQLVSTSYALKYSEKIDKVLARKKKVEKAPTKESTDIKELISTESMQIKSGESAKFLWRSKRLDLEIWDQGLEDGDVINVTLNGAPILKGHKLTNQHEKLTFMLQEGENRLQIEAVNTGAQSPNTATLQLSDGKSAYKVISYLNPKEKSNITLAVGY